MIYLKEEEIQGDWFEEPHKREVKHLIAPWTVGSSHLWVGTSTVAPGNRTNSHAHDHNEEVFFCVSGRGRFIVDDEERDYFPGCVVYCPPGSYHQVVNTGTEPLKSVCSVSPPFEQEQFKHDHDANN